MLNESTKKPVVTMSNLGNPLFGRMANNMFMYAFLKIYALEHDLQVETPKWIGQYLFGHQDPPLSQTYRQIAEQPSPYTSYKGSESLILNAKKPLKNVDFKGYFQIHTEYYARYKDYFKSLFQPINEIEEMMQKAVKQLRSRGKTIVGLHLRRGDYKAQNNTLAYLTITPNQYYREWLDGLWETLDDPVLFIASDEIEIVVHDFSDYHPVTSEDLDIELPSAPDYPDFYILSQCDVLAISNSTYSFLAAMLNETGTIFSRPHLIKEKLIPFDPWSSQPLLRFEKKLDRKKCYLSVCVYVKNDISYLIEWLEFHKLFGVERFYIYHKNSDSNVWDILLHYAQLKEVVFCHWGDESSHILTYKYWLDNYGTESEWVAFLELDEFLFSRQKSDLKKILPIYENQENLSPNIIINPEKMLSQEGIDFFTSLDTKMVKITENSLDVYESIGDRISLKKIQINPDDEPNMQIAKVVINDKYAGENYDQSVELTQFYHTLKQATEKVLNSHPVAQIMTEKWRWRSELLRLISSDQLSPEQRKEAQNLADRYLFKESRGKTMHERDFAQNIAQNLALAYHDLGDFIVAIGRKDEAINCYQKSFNFSYNYEHLQKLGEKLQIAEIPQLAENLCHRLLKQKRCDFWLIYNLANLLKEQEKWEIAALAFRKSSRINPDFFWSHYLLAECLFKQYKWDEAITAYQRAIKLDDQFFWCYPNLGYALVQTQQWEKAINICQRGIELDPNYFWLYQNLGDAWRNLQQWENAAISYTKAIEIDPNHPLSHQYLAEVLQQFSM